MDIGDNVLRDVYVDVKDLSKVVKSRSRSLKRSRAIDEAEDFCNKDNQFHKKFKEVKGGNGDIYFFQSNICTLIDWEKTKLAFINGTPNPSFILEFKDVYKTNAVPILLQASLNTISGQKITSTNDKKKFIFPIDNATKLDTIINLNFGTGSGGMHAQPPYYFTLGNVYDYFSHTHIKDSILAYKTLKQTRATSAQDNASDHWNNYISSNENQYNLDPNEPLVMSDVMTHRITDFDKFLTKLAYPKHDVWSTTDYGKRPPADDGRIPLLLIHGWQGTGFVGNKDLRNPAILGLWKNSEFAYWNHFLDYYLTSKSLQKKYHVYLYKYTSYKHVTYNAWQLRDLLEEVKKNHPNSDLAKGLNDKEIGLTILAHSMGGLVSRALIEEHKYFGVSLKGLNKLIALDTPHHGSPASHNYKPGNLAKDLKTHGAADLNWDNFDGVQKEVWKNADDNRYDKKTLNCQKFDEYYNTLAGKWYPTSNPYLAKLNKNFDELVYNYKDKYIFYTAWNVYGGSFSVDDIESMYGKAGADYLREKNYMQLYNESLLHNFINNGIMAVSTDSIGRSGYATGGAEPISSSWLAQYQSATGELGSSENPKVNDLPSVSDFADEAVTHSIDDVPLIVYSDGSTHDNSIPYRLFWDYDHEMMMGGAYENGWFGGQGVWDKYIDIGPLLSNAPEGSAFLKHKLEYVNAARQIVNPNTADLTSERLNPLIFEPVFLVIEKDLLDSAGVTLTADAGEDKTISAGQSITLDGSASTGDITGYQWGEGANVYCAESAMTTCTIADLLEGEHTIILNVYDASGSSALDTIKVTVTPTPQPSTSKVLKTGQTKCYDWDTNAEEVCTQEHKGQDGYYATIQDLGVDRSYSGMSENGVHIAVRDNATDIIWQDNSEAASFTGTWEEAKIQCQNLGISGTWRLPTIKELQTLPDFGKVNPAIDSVFENTNTLDYYWSSATDASYTGRAWGVYFSYGYSSYDYKAYDNNVRCVRSGQ